MTDKFTEYKKLAEAATAGPWGVEETRTTLWLGVLRKDSHKVDDIVCSFDVEDYNDEYTALQHANAQFIAASRYLAPELVRLVELAEGALRDIESRTVDGQSTHRIATEALAEIERVRGSK